MKNKLPLILCLAVLSSCAGTERADFIATQSQSQITNPTLKNSIIVSSVKGGAGFLDTENISDSEFKDATEKTLKHYDYLAEPATTAKFKLDIDIKKTDIDSELMSLDKEVTAQIAYKITSIQNGSVYFDKIFQTKYNAKGMGFGKGLLLSLFAGPSAAHANGQVAYLNAFKINVGEFLDALGQFNNTSLHNGNRGDIPTNGSNVASYSGNSPSYNTSVSPNKINAYPSSH